MDRFILTFPNPSMREAWENAISEMEMGVVFHFEMELPRGWCPEWIKKGGFLLLEWCGTIGHNFIDPYEWGEVTIGEGGKKQFRPCTKLKLAVEHFGAEILLPNAREMRAWKDDEY